MQNGRILSDNEDSEDEQALLDLSAGNKDCCILEVSFLPVVNNFIVLFIP